MHLARRFIYHPSHENDLYNRICRGQADHRSHRGKGPRNGEVGRGGRGRLAWRTHCACSHGWCPGLFGPHRRHKTWTAARERKPTREIGEKVRHAEKGHDIAYYGDPKYVGWGGGLPIWSHGEVVGLVAVSGLSSSEDVDLATLGVAALTDH
jgi:Haem-degrading